MQRIYRDESDSLNLSLELLLRQAKLTYEMCIGVCLHTNTNHQHTDGQSDQVSTDPRFVQDPNLPPSSYRCLYYYCLTAHTPLSSLLAAAFLLARRGEGQCRQSGWLAAIITLRPELSPTSLRAQTSPRNSPFSAPSV